MNNEIETRRLPKGDCAIPPDYVAELALTGWNGGTGEERAYCRWQLRYLEKQWANYAFKTSADRSRAMRTLAGFRNRLIVRGA